MQGEIVRWGSDGYGFVRAAAGSGIDLPSDLWSHVRLFADGFEEWIPVRGEPVLFEAERQPDGRWQATSLRPASGEPMMTRRAEAPPPARLKSSPFAALASMAVPPKQGVDAARHAPPPAIPPEARLDAPAASLEALRRWEEARRAHLAAEEHDAREILRAAQDRLDAAVEEASALSDARHRAERSLVRAAASRAAASLAAWAKGHGMARLEAGLARNEALVAAPKAMRALPEARVRLEAARAADDDVTMAAYEALLDRLRQDPAVQSFLLAEERLASHASGEARFLLCTGGPRSVLIAPCGSRGGRTWMALRQAASLLSVGDEAEPWEPGRVSPEGAGGAVAAARLAGRVSPEEAAAAVEAAWSARPSIASCCAVSVVALDAEAPFEPGGVATADDPFPHEEAQRIAAAVGEDPAFVLSSCEAIGLLGPDDALGAGAEEAMRAWLRIPAIRRQAPMGIEAEEAPEDEGQPMEARVLRKLLRGLKVGGSVTQVDNVYGRGFADDEKAEAKEAFDRLVRECIITVVIRGGASYCSVDPRHLAAAMRIAGGR